MQGHGPTIFPKFHHTCHEPQPFQHFCAGRGLPGCTPFSLMNCIQAHVGFADVRFHSVQEAQSAASGQPPCLHGAMKTFPNAGVLLSGFFPVIPIASHSVSHDHCRVCHLFLLQLPLVVRGRVARLHSLQPHELHSGSHRLR